MKIETLAIHSGYSPDPTTKAVAVPIFQTASYAFDDTQHGADLFDLKVEGNIYTRIMNPTTAVLEQRVAAMEEGVGALALSSGMAAISQAIFAIAEQGDNIVSVTTLYGGTYNLFAHTLPKLGIDVRFVDYRDMNAIAAAIDENTKAVFCESLGNPAGNIIDLEKNGRSCTCARCPGYGGQYGPYPISVPAFQVRCRHRHPFADKVYDRSRYIDWRDCC